MWRTRKMDRASSGRCLRVRTVRGVVAAVAAAMVVTAFTGAVSAAPKAGPWVRPGALDGVVSELREPKRDGEFGRGWTHGVSTSCWFHRGTEALCA